jgi:hypothetical protein
MNFESRNPEERAETYRRQWAAVETRFRSRLDQNRIRH